jgi:flagellar hook-basal body complex protein FliE
MAAIDSLYGIPEIRMRGVNSPLEGAGSGQLTQVGNLEWPNKANPAEEVGGGNFGDLLAAGIERTNQLGHVAEAQAQAFARGSLDDVHGTMISAKEAEISLRMVGTVRTKLLDAFHELWRINV